MSIELVDEDESDSNGGVQRRQISGIESTTTHSEFIDRTSWDAGLDRLGVCRTCSLPCEILLGCRQLRLSACLVYFDVCSLE